MRCGGVGGDGNVGYGGRVGLRGGGGDPLLFRRYNIISSMGRGGGAGGGGGRALAPMIGGGRWRGDRVPPTSIVSIGRIVVAGGGADK